MTYQLQLLQTPKSLVSRGLGSSTQPCNFSHRRERERGGCAVQVSARSWLGAGEARQGVMSSYRLLLVRYSGDFRLTGSLDWLFLLLVWDSEILTFPPLPAICLFPSGDVCFPPPCSVCLWLSILLSYYFCGLLMAGSICRERITSEATSPSWKVIQGSQPSHSRVSLIYYHNLVQLLKAVISHFEIAFLEVGNVLSIHCSIIWGKGNIRRVCVESAWEVYI